MFNKKRIFIFAVFCLFLFFMMTFGSGTRETVKVNTRTIEFIDGLTSELISKQDIEVGKDAEVPDEPSHEGCDFTGWFTEDNKKIEDFTNLTENLTVYSECNWQYFNVTFYDTVARRVIDTQRIRYGLDATAPTVPTHANYTFDRWSRGYTNITSDIRVDAIYTQSVAMVLYFDVTFIDNDTASVINIQNVREGLSAVFPTIPEHKNRIYDRYEGDYTNVTEDRDVTLYYKDAEKFKVTFNKGEHGLLNDTENQVTYNVFVNNTFEEGGVATPKVNPSEGYEFTGWDTEFSDSTIVDDNVTITALYDAKDVTYEVRYLEKETNEKLHDALVDQPGKFKGTSTAEAITIEGYNLVGEAKQSIELGLSGNVITFYYTAKDVTYEVRYLEKETNEKLHDALVDQPGKFKGTATAEAITIEGYDLVGEAKQSIELGLSGNIITFYYTAKDVTYEVRYLEKETNEKLHDALVDQPGKFKGTATAEAITIEGYDLVGEAKQSIELGLSGNVITFYYEKKDLAFTVNYFFDGIKDNDMTVNSTAKWQTIISASDYMNAVTGFKAPTPSVDSITIDEDVTKNVIDIMYLSKAPIIKINADSVLYRNGEIVTDGIAEYGDVLTYTVTIKNDGDGAGKIVVRDVKLFAEIGKDISTYTTSTPSIVSAFLSENGYTTNLIEPNTETSFTFNVTVTGMPNEHILSQLTYKNVGATSFNTDKETKDIRIEKYIDIKEISNKGANVVLVLDESSSMSDRLYGETKTMFQNMQDAAKIFIDEITSNSNTEVCIIAFPAINESLKYGTSKMGCSKNATTLKNYINSLDQGNGTPYTSAMRSTSEYLESGFSDTTNQYHVVFLSDGEPYEPGLTSRYEQYAARMDNCNVTVHAIGFDTTAGALSKIVSSDGILKTGVKSSTALNETFVNIAEAINTKSLRTTYGLANISNSIVNTDSVKITVVEDSTKTVTFDNLQAAIDANYIVYKPLEEIKYSVNTTRKADSTYKGFDADDEIVIEYSVIDNSNYGKTCSTKINDVYFKKSTAIVETGSTIQAEYVNYPSNASLTWSSSNEWIATVDQNGVITGVREGNVEITVKNSEGTTSKLFVTVTKGIVKVTGITLNKTTRSIDREKEFKLSATINPTDADNKNVIWSSSDESVAKVSSNGKVTAQNKNGVAIITAKTEDGGFTATCTVTVGSGTSKSLSAPQSLMIQQTLIEIIDNKDKPESEKDITNETTNTDEEVREDESSTNGTILPQTDNLLEEIVNTDEEKVKENEDSKNEPALPQTNNTPEMVINNDKETDELVEEKNESEENFSGSTLEE